MTKAILILAFVVSAAGYAGAAEVEERYSITRTVDGFIRTDVNTGQTSICTEKDGQLICRMAADDRQAYEADIAALETKIDSLEKRIIALEKLAPGSTALQSPAPSDQEFETSLNQMERFFRRFMGIVKEFQQFGGETPPVPDKTSNEL